jgi:GDP-L-fucose synthase
VADLDKILICGGTGFIGRNLVEHFAKAGHQITATHMKRTPYDTPENVTWVHADLRDSKTVHELVSGHDILIQAAATTSGSKDIVSTPYLHVTDNAVMNSHLLRACYDENIKHFVFFSCSIMYGSQELPVTEDAFQGNIEQQYFGAGWTKVYLERMCEFYAKLGKTKHTVIRHSNIYGPHDKFDLKRSHVCGATISKVQLAEKELLVWGDGNEKRDLLHIADLVNFVDLALEKQDANFGLYNCGSGQAISVNQLVKKLISLSGKELDIKHDSRKPTIDFSLSLDCSKARKELGWLPRIPLEAGLTSTIDWWRDHIDRTTLLPKIGE